ncbi:hypothetical protein K5X82_10130 [Halosquirtibacter xylanolyticus]|uniref:hypothetical protein n=1 Tax=Halosquirtibacter xylanolyticus TaxID=3374599 RepID=UPI00374A8A4F|nr:hypothetical protein K5X82_10130 [Prolixibacteraceae bacterium]
MRYLLGIILLLSSFIVQADKLSRKDKSDLDKLIRSEQYEKAIKKIEILSKRYKRSYQLQMLKGIIYTAMPEHMGEADKEIAKALELTKKPFEQQQIRYHVARAYHRQEKFQDCINECKNLLKDVEKWKRNSDGKIDQLVTMARTSSMYLDAPIDVNIDSYDVNTTGFELAPVIPLNEEQLLYSSGKGNSVLRKHYSGDKDNSSMKRLSFSKGKVITSLSMNLQRDVMVLSVARKDNYKGESTIYISKKDKGTWTKPRPLPEEINSSSEDNFASISPDGHWIFFSSKRFGGKGGYDIYRARLNRDWTVEKPKNVGKFVNTHRDEIYPVLHPNGTSLYFSTNGQMGVGGFDIYYSDEYEGTFTDPINLGYPLNSTADDFEYVESVDGTAGYLVSRRMNGKGSTDIYKVFYPDRERNGLYAVVGNYDTELHENDSIVGALENISTVKELSVNDETGDFSVIAKSGENYELSIKTSENQDSVYQAKIFVSGKEYEQMTPPLVDLGNIDPNGVKDEAPKKEEVVNLSREELQHIFFERNYARLTNYSQNVIRKLILREGLKDNDVKLALSGTIDGQEVLLEKSYLAKQRCEIVMKYLIKMGIQPERIKIIDNPEVYRPFVVDHYFHKLYYYLYLDQKVDEEFIKSLESHEQMRMGNLLNRRVKIDILDK